MLLSDENPFPGIDIVVHGNDRSEIRQRHTLENMSVLKMREEAIRIFQENFLYEQVDGRIRIEIDPESVLVLSPGRYISIMRNKTLGLLFYKLGFIESLGSGIPMVMDT